MDTSKVVVIKKFSTAGEAMIYQTLLASNGIECELINETAFDIMPMQNEWLEIKLVVAEKDEKTAKAILAAKFDQQEFETESVKRRKKP